MSHYELEEMSGKNGRNSTTLLMKSLKDILKETGADKHLLTNKTVPPRNVQAMPPAMAEAEKTLPPQVMPSQTAPVGRPTIPARATLDRPVCLKSGAKKGLLGRLFG